MLRTTTFLSSGAALLMLLAMSVEASAQSDAHRRSTGNMNPNPPRRSMGNFPVGQPNYYSTYGRQSSHSHRHSSARATVVVPSPYYSGRYYYPAVPAYPVPVYTPYGRGHVYVPVPGYGYYPYYKPGYVVPRYSYRY